MIIGLKNSPLLTQWANDLQYFMGEYLLQWKELEDQPDVLRSISLYALQNILVSDRTSENNYKLWIYNYYDYQPAFTYYTSQRQEIIDLYTRYPAADIQLLFGQPEYIVSLVEVGSDLSLAVDSNISKLAVYNNVPYWDFLWPKTLPCIHPLALDSPLALLLVHNSSFAL